MANWYSEHFAATSSATVAPPTALADPRTYAAPGRGMAKVFRKTAYLDFTSVASGEIVDADVVRMFNMKSGDRITSFLLQTDDAFVDTGTLTVDVGLYTLNDTHTGAVLDVDLFADALDIAGTANEDVDIFLQSTTLDGLDRGKALWELYTLGAGSLTADPIDTYEIGLIFNSQTAVTAGGVMALQVEFLAAGTN